MDSLAANIVSLPYISAYTYRYYCNHGWLNSDDNNRYISALPNVVTPSDVREGDYIYILTDHVERFFEEVDPKLTVRYTLISGRTYRAIDQRLAGMMSPRVIHWYTQNNMACHERVSSIPIGLQNLHWRFEGVPQSDAALITSVSQEDISPVKDILVSFTVSTNAEHRAHCLKYFASLGDIATVRPFDDLNRVKRDFVTDYFREVRRHKFVVCPFGSGYDCFRNWETFALGGIPIIQKHPSMEAFYDMPAWFVNDWSDVNRYSMDKTYDLMMSNWESYNHEKKYFAYWKRKIGFGANQPIHQRT